MREVPGGQVRELRLPQNLRSAVTVLIWHAGDLRPKGNNQVTLHPSTAAVLAVDPSAGWSSAQSLVQSAAALHYAELGGGIVRILWCAAGIAPMLLFLSGVAIWWTMYQARRKALYGPGAVGKKKIERVLVP